MKETHPPVYLHLNPGQSPPALEGGCPFKAVIVIEVDVTPEWRSVICDWLVNSGCRYAIAWGIQCREWHFGIDDASLQRFDYGEVPDSEFVMTTDHEKESLKDAFLFAAYCAHHPSLDIDRVYIIHIASRERPDEMLRFFREAEEEISQSEA
jgi:hypothetical protein